MVIQNEALFQVRGADQVEVNVSSQTIDVYQAETTFHWCKKNRPWVAPVCTQGQWYDFSDFLSPNDWTIQRINQIGYLPQQHSRNTTTAEDRHNFSREEICLLAEGYKSAFHPFSERNWTPQAMLYLQGASKLHINLVFRPVAYKQNKATVTYF